MTEYKIKGYRTMLVRDGGATVAKKRLSGFAESEALFHELLKDSPVERVYVAYLNGKNDAIGVECVAQGGLHGAALVPREVFRGAILACASAIILAHNHPSCDPSPSPEDIALTRALGLAGGIVGIPLLDHIIVTAEPGVASSLREYL